jgi:hypothetical protein
MTKEELIEHLGIVMDTGTISPDETPDEIEPLEEAPCPEI